MNTTKPLPDERSNGSKALNHNALQEFLTSTSLTQRMRPVLAELLWVVRGAPSPHEKALPEYCYRILGKFKKAYFKALPALPGECVKVYHVIESDGDVVLQEW